MRARLRSWWRQIKQHPYATGMIALTVAFLAFTLLIFLAYRFGWDWTGFTGGGNKVTTTMITPGTTTTTTPRATVATEQQPAKTLWDWLGLFAVLTIPAVVGFGAAWFTVQQSKESDRENTDNQRENALQAYIDKISELLLKEHLGEFTPEGKLKPEYKEARKIARVRTLTVVPRLDDKRKGSMLLFLHESGLIDKDKTIISLEGADFSKADINIAHLSNVDASKSWMREHGLRWSLRKAMLSKVNLREAQLWETNLEKADLSEAYLSHADLENANLEGADLHGARMRRTILHNANLTGANPTGADLSDANLREAKITEEQLKQAKSLKDATMPDGTKHP